MSIAESGTKVLLKIGDGGTPTEVFTTMPGQTSTRFGGTTSTADTTSKDDSGWQTSIAITKSGQVSCSGNYPGGGNAVIERIEDQWIAGNAINCEILINADGDKYSGSFAITNWEIDGPADGKSTYSLELAPTAALTLTRA